MKKLMIICGTGVATSTVVTGQVKEWLKENGLDRNLKLYQGKISDEVNRLDDYDVVISTTIVHDNLKDKVINGVPLLTGIDKEKVFDELRERLAKLDD